MLNSREIKDNGSNEFAEGVSSTELEDLPDEMLLRVAVQLPSSEKSICLFHLLRVNRRFREIYQEMLDKEGAKVLLKYVLDGDAVNARKMYTRRPALLFVTAEGQERAAGLNELNEPVHRVVVNSPFRAMLAAGDYWMFMDALKFIDDVKDIDGHLVGRQLAQVQMELQFPVQEEGRNPFEYPASRYDFNVIANAITNDENLRNNRQDAMGATLLLISNFKRDFLPVNSKQSVSGYYFNPLDMFELMKIYTAHVGMWSLSQKSFFSCQVIAYLLRLFTSVYAQVICTGMVNIANGYSPKRSTLVSLRAQEIIKDFFDFNFEIQRDEESVTLTTGVNLAISSDTEARFTPLYRDLPEVSFWNKLALLMQRVAKNIYSIYMELKTPKDQPVDVMAIANSTAALIAYLNSDSCTEEGLLTTNHLGQTALHGVVMRDDMSGLDALLDSPFCTERVFVAVDADNRTPFAVSLCEGRAAIAKKMVMFKHFNGRALVISDNQNETLLNLIARSNIHIDTDMLDYMIRSGHCDQALQKKNAYEFFGETKHRTVLDEAIEDNNINFIRILLASSNLPYEDLSVDDELLGLIVSPDNSQVEIDIFTMVINSARFKDFNKAFVSQSKAGSKFSPLRSMVFYDKEQLFSILMSSKHWEGEVVRRAADFTIQYKKPSLLRLIWLSSGCDDELRMVIIANLKENDGKYNDMLNELLSVPSAQEFLRVNEGEIKSLMATIKRRRQQETIDALQLEVIMYLAEFMGMGISICEDMISAVRSNRTDAVKQMFGVLSRVFVRIKKCNSSLSSQKDESPLRRGSLSLEIKNLFREVAYYGGLFQGGGSLFSAQDLAELLNQINDDSDVDAMRSAFENFAVTGISRFIQQNTQIMPRDLFHCSLMKSIEKAIQLMHEHAQQRQENTASRVSAAPAPSP